MNKHVEKEGKNLSHGNAYAQEKSNDLDFQTPY